VVDGFTYVFSFLVIATVVRAGRRVEAAAQQKGVLGGLRFLLADSLLGPMMIAACVINFVAQGIVLGVQAIDYFRYDASGHVVGLLFGGFGVGALLGALVAQQLAQKVPLLKLAAVSIVLMPLPLFLLAPHTPWPVAMVIVGAFAFFTPLVNAPVIGLLTVRTPAELRPKVMTAVMTVASMAGPFGFIAAGYILRHVELGPFFVGLPALLTLGGLAFAAVLLRDQEPEPLEVGLAS
jgi:predicted MFS family arabinose efflux permease